MGDSHSFITMTITKKNSVCLVKASRNIPSLYPDKLPQQVLAYPRSNKQKPQVQRNQTPCNASCTFLREELPRSSRFRNQVLCIYPIKKKQTTASAPRPRSVKRKGSKKKGKLFTQIIHVLYCISKIAAALRRSAAVLAMMGLVVFQSPSSILSRMAGKTAPSLDQASGPKTTLLNWVRLGIWIWSA
jgi:hypothetical protein